MAPDEFAKDSGGATPTGDNPAGALPDGVHCVHCGYHLRGVVGPRCPECGYDLVGLRSTESGIPWSRRRDIGHFRAYWATVWAVTFYTRKFCEEHAREVSYRDARLFQWVTLVLVFPPIAFGLWDRVLQVRVGLEDQLASKPGTYSFSGLTMLEQAILENWPLIVLTCCLFLFLFAVTGVPSYFFHPRESSTGKQNAGIAMSYYACGSLAIGWLIAISILVGVALLAFLERSVYGYGLLDHPNTLGRSTALVMTFGMPVFLWWYTLVRLANGMMPELKRIRVYFAVLLPAIWILLGGVIVIGLLLAFSVAVVFDSLR